jgi:hypothetical protein
VLEKERKKKSKKCNENCIWMKGTCIVDWKNLDRIARQCSPFFGQLSTIVLTALIKYEEYYS